MTTAENPLGAQRVRTFSNTDALNIHEIIHTGEKAFKGISCDKNFSTSGMLLKETWDGPHNEETNDVSKILCKSNRIGDT